MPFHGNTNLLCGFVLVHLFYKGFSFLKCKLLMCVLPILAIGILSFSLFAAILAKSYYTKCLPSTYRMVLGFAYFLRECKTHGTSCPLCSTYPPFWTFNEAGRELAPGCYTFALLLLLISLGH